MTDHPADACPYPWCQARACDCPYSSAQPHARAGCRYANDDQHDRPGARRVTSAHDRMSEHLARQRRATPDDPAVTAAVNAVALARHRLHETRRQFIRRECGSTDVAIAEHDLSLALDQLDRANRNTP